MDFDNLLLERDGAVALVTINRPQVLNALNSSALDDLRRAALALKHDGQVRAVVVTGQGDKSFVAGADINEIAVNSPAESKDFAIRGQHVFDLIENLGKPVIAAINGYALGGGCELAMACTLRIAAETARLGQPEINLGIIPGYGGTQRLARLVGKGVALDMLLTGRHVTAAEALQIGLVNRVVPAADLLSASFDLAARVLRHSPLAASRIITAVTRGLNASIAEGLAIESEQFARMVPTRDMREALDAWLARRKPEYQGC
jgi:enoyl-CoA hydratase